MMKRFHFYLSGDQFAALKELAAEKGCSLGGAIRGLLPSVSADDVRRYVADGRHTREAQQARSREYEAAQVARVLANCRR